MLNLIFAEFYKLKRSKGIKLCFGFTVICSISMAIISHNVAIGKLNLSISGSASGLSEVVIMSLIGSIMTGILVCNDFETKTIHDEIIGGNGRKSIVYSKAIVFSICIALLLLPYIVVTFIGCSSDLEFSKLAGSSGFMNIIVENKSLDFSAFNVGRILLISITLIIVYIGRISLFIPIAFKSRKPMIVMSVGFGLSTLVDIFIGLLGDISGVSKIILLTPYSREYLLISMETEFTMILKAMVVNIIFTIIMIYITYKIFRKSEIK